MILSIFVLLCGRVITIAIGKITKNENFKYSNLCSVRICDSKYNYLGLRPPQFCTTNGKRIHTRTRAPYAYTYYSRSYIHNAYNIHGISTTLSTHIQHTHNTYTSAYTPYAYTPTQRDTQTHRNRYTDTDTHERDQQQR